MRSILRIREMRIPPIVTAAARLQTLYLRRERSEYACCEEKTVRASTKGEGNALRGLMKMGDPEKMAKEVGMCLDRNIPPLFSTTR
jgi:hypothetical protein